eukprot:1586230-Rhodomonas_salina.2
MGDLWQYAEGKWAEVAPDEGGEWPGAALQGPGWGRGLEGLRSEVSGLGSRRDWVQSSTQALLQYILFGTELAAAVPGARYSASLVALGSMLYLFGGPSHAPPFGLTCCLTLAIRETKPFSGTTPTAIARNPY